MNMPVAENQTVQFTTTLFALIRESLAIKMGPSKSIFNMLCRCSDRSLQQQPYSVTQGVHSAEHNPKG